MWHQKSCDLKVIDGFIRNLAEFQKLKLERWEKIDEEVQMSIKPGTPSEDWIIPPDESKTTAILHNDPDYLRLRKDLTLVIPKVKAIASFLRIDVHHDFDWVNFSTPLIGNAALEDGLAMAGKLRRECEAKNYPIQHFVSFFDFSGKR